MTTENNWVTTTEKFNCITNFSFSSFICICFIPLHHLWILLFFSSCLSFFLDDFLYIHLATVRPSRRESSGRSRRSFPGRGDVSSAGRRDPSAGRAADRSTAAATLASQTYRKVLPLSEKVRVIKAAESGKSNRAVAEEFQCGRTQVAVSSS